ncbi:MAG: hypothetical protein IPI91_17315 [Flavobacteriales bacterium]|nr:hypothetical protein [Flavobacteriales bacterium]
MQNPVVGAAGTYVLTVTGSNGCTSSASTEVQILMTIHQGNCNWRNTHLFYHKRNADGNR